MLRSSARTSRDPRSGCRPAARDLRPAELGEGSRAGARRAELAQGAATADRPGAARGGPPLRSVGGARRSRAPRPMLRGEMAEADPETGDEDSEADGGWLRQRGYIALIAVAFAAVGAVAAPLLFPELGTVRAAIGGA